MNSAWFKYTMSDGGKGEKLDDFLEAVRKFIPYIPDGYVESSEFGAADASIAPFLVSVIRYILTIAKSLTFRPIRPDFNGRLDANLRVLQEERISMDS